MTQVMPRYIPGELPCLCHAVQQAPRSKHLCSWRRCELLRWDQLGPQHHEAPSASSQAPAPSGRAKRDGNETSNQVSALATRASKGSVCGADPTNNTKQIYTAPVLDTTCAVSIQYRKQQSCRKVVPVLQRPGPGNARVSIPGPPPHGPEHTTPLLYSSADFAVSLLLQHH